MSRLRLKLVLALVGTTLVTILLMSVPLMRAIVAENRSLPAPERSALNPITVIDRAVLVPRNLPRGGFITIRSLPSAAEFPVVSAQVESEGWVRMGEVTSYLRGSLEERAGTLIVAGLLALAIAIGLALILARVIAKPIQTVAMAADRLAAGDLSARVASGDSRQSPSIAALFAAARSAVARFVGTPFAAAAGSAGSGSATSRSGASGSGTSSGSVAFGTVAPRESSAGDVQGAPPKDETALLARSFNAMADSLERLERQRRELVADVAHELRTPLTVLRGRLEALEDGVVPLSLEEVSEMHAQVLILTRLVEDLRTLSLADAGRLTMYPQQLDLVEVVRSAAASYRLQAADKGVALVTDDVETLTAEADRERLLQVLGNLLDNALRHTPSGGRVTLGVRAEGETALIEVADTGPGIPQGSEERVFERFHRTDESRARSAGGSGLGLAIVKAIVESHGGSVAARRGAEGGAVLSVRLPR